MPNKKYNRRKFSYKSLILVLTFIVLGTALIDKIIGKILDHLQKSDKKVAESISHWPHPFMVFRAKANVPGKTNEFGWYASPLEAKTRRRLLVMGNSVVQGNWEDTSNPNNMIPAMNVPMDRFLKTKGYSIETLPGGYASYNSSQLLAALVHEAIDSKPDFIVFLDGYLDFYYPFGLESRPGYPYKFRNVEGALQDQNIIAKKVAKDLSLFDLFLMKLNLPRLVAGNDFGRLIVEKSSLASGVSNTDQKVLERDKKEDLSPYCNKIIQNWKKAYYFAKGYGIDILFALQPTIRNGDEERGYACLRNKALTEAFLKERFIDFDKENPLVKTDFKDMIHPGTLKNYERYTSKFVDLIVANPKFKNSF